MKVAFVSISNPFDRIARSGVPYSIFRELLKGNEVEWIKPEIKTFWEHSVFTIGRVLEKIVHLCGYNMMHNSFKSRALCHNVERKIFGGGYDCIFTMGSVETAFLNVEIPIFCRTDAIVHSMENYYYFKIPKFASRMARRLEERALHNYSRFFVPSKWILDEIAKYGINEPLNKFPLVETGANLDDDYISFKEHLYSLDKRINLLFVGYDVKRKGIDVAYCATQRLRDLYALDAHLTIMGGKPEKNIIDSDFVHYVGNKNKNDEKQYDEFYHEFASADLFILPTKAECHGIVNCEAAAYGLPIFAYNTGGVSSYCIDGVNGKCLPIASTGDDFAEEIFLALETGNMKKYSDASRRLYKERFNWGVWGEKVRKEMEIVLYGKN